MNYEIPDRRERTRAGDTLTKIEDLTYSVLRKSMATERDSIQHDSARMFAGISHSVFLLVPIVAISFVAVLFARGLWDDI